MEDRILCVSNENALKELFPETIYKYRDWKNEYHKKILTNRELFFPSFENLNDLFDGHIPFRFSNKDIDRKKYKKELKKINKHEYDKLTKKKLDNMYRRFQSGQDWKNMLPHHKDFVNSIYGVMSLSENPTIVPMWAHYGGNHTGIAIGFNLLELYKIVQGTVCYVNYTEEPILMPFGNSRVEDYLDLFSTKSPEWKYEQEIRILKAFYSNKIVKLNRNSINKIVFGYKIDLKDKEEIIKIVNQNFDNVTFYTIEQDVEKLKFMKKEEL